MRCEVLSVDRRAIARAAQVLRAGGLVAFPTETVYGLGGNALDPLAVARIFAAKGRPATNPIIVHVADIDAAKKLAFSWPASADKLAQQFWPGPLTLVLPKQAFIPDSVTAGGPTIALRVPAHPVAQQLLRECQLPLAAPSANRSTELSPTTATHVLHGLADAIDLLLDAGPTPGGLESTVLDVTTDPPRLLRPGLVTVAQMEAIVGPIATFQGLSDGNAPARSPGQMVKHYAPRTPLEVAVRSHERVDYFKAHGLRVGWLTHDDVGEVSTVLRILLPADPVCYAAQMYAALYDLDAAGLDRIIVEMPPADAAWLAIHDRLRRASAATAT